MVQEETKNFNTPALKVFLKENYLTRIYSAKPFWS